MSFSNRLPLLGIVLLAAAVLAGCESKSMPAASRVAQTVPPVPVSMTGWKLITLLHLWKSWANRMSVNLICLRILPSRCYVQLKPASLARGANMQIKHYLIGVYIVIALLFSAYLKGCSATADRSYAYNLGKAMVWPVSMFN